MTGRPVSLESGPACDAEHLMTVALVVNVGLSIAVCGLLAAVMLVAVRLARDDPPSDWGRRGDWPPDPGPPDPDPRPRGGHRRGARPECAATARGPVAIGLRRQHRIPLHAARTQTHTARIGPRSPTNAYTTRIRGRRRQLVVDDRGTAEAPIPPR